MTLPVTLNERDQLDHDLHAAHAAGDMPALVTLYGRAADHVENLGDTDAACFYLTHAYVFALELGQDQATDIHARLLQYGREE